MAHTTRDTLPKLGRVHEVCREWLVREDGALAYRLQNQEITEHYSGNRHRNAQVREDFPRALDEQIREQELAEQAAQLYHQMILEQEELDRQVAKQVADKIEREELNNKKAREQQDAEIARQILDKERQKQIEKSSRHQNLTSQNGYPSRSNHQIQNVHQSTSNGISHQNYQPTQSNYQPEYQNTPSRKPVYNNYNDDYNQPIDYVRQPNYETYEQPIDYLNQQLPRKQQQQQQPEYVNCSPKRVTEPQQRKLADLITHSPRKPQSNGEVCRQRQGYLMPLPNQEKDINSIASHSSERDVRSASSYTRSSENDIRKLGSSGSHSRQVSDSLSESFQQCRVTDLDIGIPIDEIDERRIQEERDAELARKLQEQEGNIEEIQMNRDRLLAIEAQDKELARLLQEREKAKAKRAKERAKQKALAKKQLEMSSNENQILPDDSYSNPVDLLQHPECSNFQNNEYQHNSLASNTSNSSSKFSFPSQSRSAAEDDVNYAFPVDHIAKNLHQQHFDVNLKQNYSPNKNYDLNGSPKINGRMEPFASGSGMGHCLERENMPVRPTQLDLKMPLNKSVKPRMPEPALENTEMCDPLPVENPNYSSQHSHINIAMAIDPTYTRRSNISQTPSSHDTTTSSTSSTTSPAISLPPPDLSEDELSPVPPYMPIQGQRRTASLEKKPKKNRAKDGCKQQ